VPVIQIENPKGEPFYLSLSMRPAPDVVKVFPNLKATRFQINTDCPIDSCDLMLDVPGGAGTKVPFSNFVHPRANAGVVETPSLMLYVDSVVGLDSYAIVDARRHVKVGIATVIASLYSRLTPVFATIGATGLMLATFFRRRFPLPIALLALGLASAVAVVTLIVLMSYVLATSAFGVATVLYTSPASPFLITFSTLGLYSWYVALKTWALAGSEETKP